jgi:hypothetical protein
VREASISSPVRDASVDCSTACRHTCVMLCSPLVTICTTILRAAHTVCVKSVSASFFLSLANSTAYFYNAFEIILRLFLQSALRVHICDSAAVFCGVLHAHIAVRIICLERMACQGGEGFGAVEA